MPSRSRLIAPLAVACAALIAGLLWMDPRGHAVGSAVTVPGTRPGGLAWAGETDDLLARPGSSRTVHEPQAPPDREAQWVAAQIAARTATVEIVVRTRGSGQPIPGASAWVVDSSFRRKRCDDAGRATFRVLPGKTLVGGEPPSGSDHLLEIAYDPLTDEPAAESDVTLADGEHGSVDVALFPAASIRGRVVDADGEPMALFGFMLVERARNDWARPRSVWTDESGRFTIKRLERGTYLVGPDPEDEDVFPLERLELEWGEAKELELVVAASGPATIHVSVVQEGTGDPWPFPVLFDLERGDGLGDLGRTLQRTRLYIARGPVPLDHEFDARPGPYRVSADFLESRLRHRNWICGEWQEEMIVEVTDAFGAVDVELTVPRLGPIAHVEGYLSRSLASSRSSLLVRFGDGGETDYTIVPRASDKRFDIWVDLDAVPTNDMQFIELRSGRETVLSTVAILEGTQQVSVTPQAK